MWRKEMFYLALEHLLGQVHSLYDIREEYDRYPGCYC
jgi:hypothetical protein